MTSLLNQKSNIAHKRLVHNSTVTFDGPSARHTDSQSFTVNARTHRSSSGKGSGNRRKETRLRESEDRTNSLDGVSRPSSLDVGSSEQSASISLDYSVKSCRSGESGRDGTLVGWVRYALDPEVARRKRGRAFHRYLSGIKRCRCLGGRRIF